MNDDSKFWLSIWRIFGAAICLIVATVAGCVSYQTKQMTDLIASGKDPVQVRCAMSSGYTDAAQAAVCTAAVLHGSQK